MATSLKQKNDKKPAKPKASIPKKPRNAVVKSQKHEIFDYPELLDSGEELIPFRESLKFFPTRPSKSLGERWLRDGARGSVLKTIKIGARRYTTKGAIDQFIRGQKFNLPPQSASQQSASQSKPAMVGKIDFAALAAAKAELSGK